MLAGGQPSASRKAALELTSESSHLPVRVSHAKSGQQELESAGSGQAHLGKVEELRGPGKHGAQEGREPDTPKSGGI